MKKIIYEELVRMKYLFEHERGVIISEQKVISQLVKDVGGDWNQVKKDFGSSGSYQDNMKIVQAWQKGWRPGQPIPDEFKIGGTSKETTSGEKTTDKITYDNGGSYEGEIVNGQPNGKGKYTYPSGVVYEGDFVNDKFEGKGKYTYPSGVVYEGDFVNDNLEGKGKYTYPDGAVFEGNFIKDGVKGEGVYTNIHGFKFKGNFDEWRDPSTNSNVIVLLTKGGGYKIPILDMFKEQFQYDDFLKQNEGYITNVSNTSTDNKTETIQACKSGDCKKGAWYPSDPNPNEKKENGEIAKDDFYDQ